MLILLHQKKKEKILKFYLNKIEILYYSKYKNNILCSGSQELKRLNRRLKSLKINREIINLIDRSNDIKEFDNQRFK